jgi:hypothetical protein
VLAVDSRVPLHRIDGINRSALVDEFSERGKQHAVTCTNVQHASRIAISQNRSMVPAKRSCISASAGSNKRPASRSSTALASSSRLPVAFIA